MRRQLSLIALALATLVLGLRIREINKPRKVELAPRTVHLLYLDSLRTALLTYAEQYGKPVFVTDTVSPVNGYGRIQMRRLRDALFAPQIEYSYGDKGFSIEWRGDWTPRTPRFDRAVTLQEFDRILRVLNRRPISNSWPESAAEYARLRREFITPRWPEPPARRSRGERNFPTPPRDAFALQAATIN